MLQGLTPFPAILAALIVGTDRRIVRSLTAGRAYTSASAIVLPRRNPVWRWRVRRLEGRGALVRVANSNRLYLDPAGWQAYRTSRRRRILIVLSIVVPAGALFLWMTRV